MKIYTFEIIKLTLTFKSKYEILVQVLLINNTNNYYLPVLTFEHKPIAIAIKIKCKTSLILH